MSDQFRTIETEQTTIMKVEGSRFFGLSSPVETSKQAEELINSVRQKRHDATHHCYAYRLRTGNNAFRFNDDGEPSGTAGKPILVAIDKYGVTDIVVVVTRYFGGTKLGTGGLARAYGAAAESVLAKSKIVVRSIMEPLAISFPHSQIGNVMRLITKDGINIAETDYDEEVHLKLLVRQSLKESLQQDLLDQTAGKVRLGKS